MKIHKNITLPGDPTHTFVVVNGVLGKWGAEIATFVESHGYKVKRSCIENGHHLLYVRGGREDLPSGPCSHKCVFALIKNPA
jgi:hypothetical protein